MAVRKTTEEKNEAVKLLQTLKDKMPKYSFFGDDNHQLIELQIECLQGKLFESGIWSYGDSIASQLIDVFEWMRGDNNDWIEYLQSDIDL